MELLDNVNEQIAIVRLSMISLTKQLVIFFKKLVDVLELSWNVLDTMWIGECIVSNSCYALVH